MKLKTTRLRVIVGTEIAALVFFALLFLRMGGPPFPRWLFGPTFAAVGTSCPGDINQDGQRDIRDLTLLQAHVSGKQLLTGTRLDAADVNGDGKVDVLDVVRLQQHVTRQQLLDECRATMTVTPASLDFGNVAVGQTKDLTVAVSNVGSAALTVASIAIANSNFAVTSPAIPFNVAAGSQQAVTVRFAPPAAGLQAGTLTISATSGGVGMSSDIALSGTGVVSNNAVPTTTSISPASATAGDSAFTLTVNGSNFVNGSTVLWNGLPRPTIFVSAARVTAAIAATDLARDDSVNVVVFNPEPGGGSSNPAVFIISPNPVLPPAEPAIRIISPKAGKIGSQFNLLGNGFSAVAANNRVIFSRPDASDVVAQVSSAAEDNLTAVVPAGLQNKTYIVTVKVGGKTTNPAPYEVSSTAASLVIVPSSATLLMPPGNGKEFLLIGGGVPPYKLAPLSAQDQPKARVELKGNVLEITGLDPGTFANDVSITVTDSASPAASARATARVQVPRFDPTISLDFATLLAGSSPPLTVNTGYSFGDMRFLDVKIRFEKVKADLSSLKPGDILGLANADSGTDFQVLQVTSADSPSKVSFEVRRDNDGLPETVGQGVFEAGASDSATLTLSDFPLPSPEAVWGTSTDVAIQLADGLLRLSGVVNDTVTAVSTFRSVTVFKGKSIPLTKTFTKSFRTVAPAAGATKLTRLLPMQGETGRIVQVIGSGFSGIAANNKVTFAGAGSTRVEALVSSGSPDRLDISVPFGAVSGPVRVKVGDLESNDYQFLVPFHPEASLAFSQFTANSPTAPVLRASQQSGDLTVDTLKITLDDGRVSAGALQINQSAGTASLFDDVFGRTDKFVLVYGGQETSGAKRYFFDIKESLASGSSKARIFMSDNPGGKGVIFELALTRSADLPGHTLVTEFEKAVYTPPGAAGATVNISTQIRSSQWNYFKDARMVVTFKGLITTE